MAAYPAAAAEFGDAEAQECVEGRLPPTNPKLFAREGSAQDEDAPYSTNTVARTCGY